MILSMALSWLERKPFVDLADISFGLGSVMNETLITLTNQEKKNWVADWHCEFHYERS